MGAHVTEEDMMSSDPTKTVDQERAERHARMAAAQQEANDIAAANRAWFAQIERAAQQLAATTPKEQ